jgi:hypothetical protein
MIDGTLGSRVTRLNYKHPDAVADGDDGGVGGTGVMNAVLTTLAPELRQSTNAGANPDLRKAELAFDVRLLHFDGPIRPTFASLREMIPKAGRALSADLLTEVHAAAWKGTAEDVKFLVGLARGYSKGVAALDAAADFAGEAGTAVSLARVIAPPDGERASVTAHGLAMLAILTADGGEINGPDKAGPDRLRAMFRKIDPNQRNHFLNALAIGAGPTAEAVFARVLRAIGLDPEALKKPR